MTRKRSPAHFIPGMTTKQTICLVILALTLIFKFWLIAEMEITDDADDPVNYVEQILMHRGLCYGPGTGEVGRLFFELRLPFRIGIEAAFLISTLLVVKALVEWPVNSYRALGLYLFVIFDPAVEELLSHLMSDQVWLVETLLGFACLVFFAGTTTKIRWAWVALAGLFLGFSTMTRSTFVPLTGIFLIWAVVAGGLARFKAHGRAVHLAAIRGCAVCLYSVALFYYSTCYHNSKANGFFGISALDSREYEEFYLCLQSVGDPTGDRYYPVDDDRLKLVASAGPRSRWFVEQLGKDSSFRKISQDVYGKPGLALCWFHWAVFETVDADGDLDKTFALFKDVEREIANAARENRLRVRSIVPLPDCRLPIVLSAVPACFGHVASLVTWEPSRYAWAWSGDEPRFADPRFTLALRRRPVTPSLTRDAIGVGLCAVYARVYAPLLAGLVLAVGAFLAGLVYRWRKIPAFTFRFLAQQIFLVAFIVYFLWYLLFDASGLLAVPRYLVFNNVMLPLLLVYYARKAGQLLAGKEFDL